jgi:hypothetical protein
MAATWTETFGANATFGSDAGGVFVKFYVDGMAATTGITPANVNSSTGAEKALATLIKFNAARTYTATHNLTIAENFTAINTEQRNGVAKWKKGYDVVLYASATGVPTTIDPDDV